jgi:CheY-like chemotaxis protein
MLIRIGLNIVRGLLQMHAGTVDVRSAGPGLGSVFTVRLPISAGRQPDDHATALQAAMPRQCSILLIEDNIDAHETLKNFLTLEGHTVSSAFDGKTGLAMAKVDNHDVIICDIGLPGVNGYEVVGELRRQAARGSPPVTIAITGYGQQEDRQRAAGAGFDHYLVKPIDANTLLSVIASSVTASRS